MPEREDFGGELEPRADRGPTRGQYGDDQRSHRARERISLWPATATGPTRTEYLVGTPCSNVGDTHETFAPTWEQRLRSQDWRVADLTGLVGVRRSAHST